MKNILKAIGAGVALGVAFFLVPFLGHLLLFVLLLRVAFQLLGGRRGRRRWLAGRYGAFPLTGAVPIDNQWYQMQGAPAGPVSRVAVA